MPPAVKTFLLADGDDDVMSSRSLTTSSERAEERPDNIRMINASVRVSAGNGFTTRWRFPL